MSDNTPISGYSGCATTAGRMGCPTHGQVYGGVAAAMQVQVFTQGAEWCALGYHAWMPWLPITADDGRVLRYETYCVRCRHPEQFDL